MRIVSVSELLAERFNARLWVGERLRDRFVEALDDPALDGDRDQLPR